MNNRKKIFASLLAFGVLFNVFSIPAFAADVTEGTEQIIRYEDGSYTVGCKPLSLLQNSGVYVKIFLSK